MRRTLCLVSSGGLEVWMTLLVAFCFLLNPPLPTTPQATP